MLFAYTYVPHQMEKMQKFIDFIFFNVWSKAPGGGPFNLGLFEGNPDLHELMEKFYYSDAKGAHFFYGHVERIYGLFALLSNDGITQFQQWYLANNDLEKICANDAATPLARYIDIEPAYPELAQQLASFFKGLYSQSLLGMAALRDKIGDIDNHYLTFVRTNKAGTCPFCGINDILGEYHSKREAYDHYLPKSLYPFNAINFKNLVPACHHCNSSYKLDKDTAYTPKDPARSAQRRKFFYPYTKQPYRIEVSVDLGHANIDELGPEDINLQFRSAALDQEITTWRDVYGIDERYKAKLLGENTGKYWLVQVLDEWQEDGKPPEQFLKTLTRQAEKKPFAESNFLKRPFLEACQEAGIFKVGDHLPNLASQDPLNLQGNEAL